MNFKRDEATSVDNGHSDCEGSAIIPIFDSFTESGFSAFKTALIARLGSTMDDSVPTNYTVAGWNSTAS